MSYLYPTVKRALVLALSLTVIFQVSFSQLAFNNPVLVSGTDLKQGAVYRYDNVAPFVKAFVPISHIENGSTILHMDENGFGYNGGTTTGLPFQFPTLNANILDIDGSNHIKEFATQTTTCLPKLYIVKLKNIIWSLGTDKQSC